MLTILKIGGNILDDAPTLQNFLQSLANLDGAKVLVHGGGKIATQLAQKLGIDTQMIDGRRVTTADMRDLAVMVYAGLLNKQITARLQALETDALGVCGADMGIISANKRVPSPIDYGWVGDIAQVRADIISGWLEQGILPVFSAITADKMGNLLNTNADSIAQAVAMALAARHTGVRLWYIFEQKGVLADINAPDSVLPTISPAYFDELVGKQAIHSGMIPKLQNAFAALRAGVQEVRIASIDILQNPQSGTLITL